VNTDTKLSPPDLSHLAPARVPPDLDHAFGQACDATCQFVAAALNNFSPAPRQAVLAAMTAGSSLDVTFTLKPDGSIRAAGAMGATSLFTITSRRDRARDH
jgi:hypothetical protein